jgi:hypothetical protein
MIDKLNSYRSQIEATRARDAPLHPGQIGRGFMRDSIVIFDSVEKTGGSSIKHLLRLNIAEDCFFDYDNGDPPSVTWRGYGIKCDAGGTPPSLDFRDRRGQWLQDNHANYDLKCVYGHGLMQGTRSITELLAGSDKSLRLATFLREPTRRIISEYHYVLTNRGHPDHEAARSVKDVVRWFSCPQRDKNRQTRGILGREAELDGGTAARRLLSDYAYFGLTDRMAESIYLMCKAFDLKLPSVPRINATKKPPYSPEFYERARRVFFEFDSHDYQLYDIAKRRFEEHLASQSKADKQAMSALNGPSSMTRRSPTRPPST